MTKEPQIITSYTIDRSEYTLDDHGQYVLIDDEEYETEED